jgi:hypothetical protein
VWPVQFTNADSADLRQSLKDDRVRMVSTIYEKNGDLAAAQKRLAPLRLANPAQTFNELIAQEKTTNQKDALIHLGQALGFKLGFTTSSPPPISGTPTIVAVVVTPTPVVPIFALVEHVQLTCADEPEIAHLRFIVRNAAGKPLPNIGVQIRSADIDDTVFTGLKPEQGEGYADYEATPGTFSVTLINAQGDTVSDLLIGPAPANCKTDRGTTPRGWKLVFQQK